MTTPVKFICFHCQRFVAETWSCAAFPDGIPNALDIAGADHRVPLEGDSGLLFRPKSTEDAKRVEELWGKSPTPYEGKLDVKNPSALDLDEEPTAKPIGRANRGK